MIVKFSNFNLFANSFGFYQINFKNQIWSPSSPGYVHWFYSSLFMIQSILIFKSNVTFEPINSKLKEWIDHYFIILKLKLMTSKLCYCWIFFSKLKVRIWYKTRGNNNDLYWCYSISHAFYCNQVLYGNCKIID